MSSISLWAVGLQSCGPGESDRAREFSCFEELYTESESSLFFSWKASPFLEVAIGHSHCNKARALRLSFCHERTSLQFPPPSQTHTETLSQA